MRFNFEDYKKSEYVMLCATKEESDDFRRVMHDEGFKWCAGQTYLKLDYFDRFKNGIGYRFNEGTCESKEFWDEIGHQYNILKWSDFMNKEFTKDDLIAGMLVEVRCKNRFVLRNGYNGKLLFASGDKWHDCTGLRDDMTWHPDSGVSRLDIMKVYSVVKSPWKMDTLDASDRELLFERTETVELTLDEIAQKLGIAVNSLKIIK